MNSLRRIIFLMMNSLRRIIFLMMKRVLRIIFLMMNSLRRIIFLMMNSLRRIIFLLLPVLIITVIALELKPEKDENVYKLLTPILYAIAGIICIGFFALVVYGMYMLGTKGSSFDIRKNGEKWFEWREYVIVRLSVAILGWIVIHVMLYYLFPDIWKEYRELANGKFFWITQIAIASVVALFYIWAYIGFVAKIFAVGIAIIWFSFLYSHIENESEAKAVVEKPIVYEICVWFPRYNCSNSYIQMNTSFIDVQSGTLIKQPNPAAVGGGWIKGHSKDGGETYQLSWSWTRKGITEIGIGHLICPIPGELPCNGHYVGVSGTKSEGLTPRIVIRPKG
jgi:hypothetical protein